MTVGSHYQSRPKGGRERAVTGVLREREKTGEMYLMGVVVSNRGVQPAYGNPAEAIPRRIKTSGLILLLPPDVLPVILIGQTC